MKPRTHFFSFLNKLPLFAPPDSDGGAGGQQDENQGDNTGQGQTQSSQQIDPISGQPIVAPIVDEFDETLGLFADLESKRTADEAKRAKEADAAAQRENNPAAVSTQIATQMKSMMTNFRLNDDVLKDVDLSDPTAVKTVLERSIQAAFPAMFQMMMLPMQAQFKATQAEYKKLISDSTKSAVSGQSENDQMLREVPLLADPTHGPMLRGIQATISDQPLATRVKTMKAIIARMGIDMGKKKDVIVEQGQTLKTGAAALDELFGS